MDVIVPVVKISNNGYFFGIGGPDGKSYAGFSLKGKEVGAKLFISPFMGSFVKKMSVEVCNL